MVAIAAALPTAASATTVATTVAITSSTAPAAAIAAARRLRLVQRQPEALLRVSQREHLRGGGGARLWVRLQRLRLRRAITATVTAPVASVTATGSITAPSESITASPRGGNLWVQRRVHSHQRRQHARDEPRRCLRDVHQACPRQVQLDADARHPRVLQWCPTRLPSRNCRRKRASHARRWRRAPHPQHRSAGWLLRRCVSSQLRFGGLQCLLPEWLRIW